VILRPNTNVQFNTNDRKLTQEHKVLFRICTSNYWNYITINIYI